ncbi:MAG: leucyl aminopeptidase [Candidatus Dasytiphilus stammeri]
MHFSIKKTDISSTIKSDCIVIGIFESRKLSISGKYFDEMSNLYISTLLLQGDLDGNIGQYLLLYNVPNIPSKRLLLIGCGRERKLNKDHYHTIINNMINILNKTGSKEAVLFLPELYIKKYNIYWKIRQAVETIKNALYSFEEFKTNKTKSKHRIQKIIFNISHNYDYPLAELAIKHGIAIADGIKIAKDLSNFPPNICNSSYMTAQAYQLSKLYKNIKVSSVNESKMRDLGMNAYLAVGEGSKNESIMSIIEYLPNLNDKPIVLIGKGLTFDAGGLSIKPANAMEEMKYDMCGAACVYGIMHIVAKLELPLNIIGILAVCENMISEKCFHPGDILTTLSGKTVEVLNTDAEGRLVLCDVLTYVERFQPQVVIDIATLTGACVIALGNDISGLISNHNSLASELLKASELSGDLAWQLPMIEKYQDQLKSNCADMTNVSGGSSYGGAITAACFLARFTTKYKWAHLDIAGTAWQPKTGATGRPVALLSQFLLNKLMSSSYLKKDLRTLLPTI